MNKKIYSNFILVLSLLFLSQSSLFSQVMRSGMEKDARLVNPLYELNVRNIELSAGSSAMGINSLTFDIIIYHTNEPDSGPFLFAAGFYTLLFNPAINGGGMLTYEIVPNTSDLTNPDAIPVNPHISGNKLILDRNPNYPVNDAPVISAVYPGTRIVQMKLSTSAFEFGDHPLNLTWGNTPSTGGGTAVYAYLGDSATDISGDGTYSVDSSNIPLPVELSSFSSTVNRSNVILQWSTSSELNNSGFDIERSSADNNNNTWVKAGYVRGIGSSDLINNYTFEDKALNSGKYIYRLKQIDFNGNFEYFNLQNEVIIGVPENFSLKQNYPNPFNPVTKIDFDLPLDSRVSLKVYNTEGKEIQSLVNGALNSGYYSIEFDASSLPSGVYYYRLESGSFTSTRKLVLLK
ncbi:MAG TPA: T9SS type A sorting domain-containing protein [Ignavibacteria bacterium]|nr:T9SS type A sorting domain-containing protein [Ignavibacteria bacterium]HMR40790.1 T9SS type A sorting domain-containing protein [Ignavibacteria bacterium]